MMKKDILSEIVANKRFEVDFQKTIIPFEELEVSALEPRTFRSMRASLAASKSGIISEFKRRSPSKGWIKEHAEAAMIIPSYETAGASALSILTDEKFFGGSLGDIRMARPLVNLPILRKDFIVDEYQILQARVAGADAILLIAACLSQFRCEELATFAHKQGLEVLLEVHTEEELDYISSNVDMAGINNRNLGTFYTSIENSYNLAELLNERVDAFGKEAPLLVSESGISKPDTVAQLRKAGFRGFLIGETFMKTEQPGETLRDFIKEVESAN